MSRARLDRRGVALALVLFVLVVLAALVEGSFFSAWLEQQSADRILFSTQAAEAAEAGVVDALATIAPAALTGLVGSAPLELLPLSLPNGTLVERRVKRLSGTLFLVTARSTRQDAAGGALATRSVGLLVRVVADSGSGLQSAQVLPSRAWVQLY